MTKINVSNSLVSPNLCSQRSAIYRLTFSIVKLDKPANNPNTEIQLRHWEEMEIYIFDVWQHCQFHNFSLLEQDLNMLIWNFKQDQGEKVYLWLLNFDDPCMKCCIKASKEADHVGWDRKLSLRYLHCLYHFIMKLGLKREVQIFDFFSFDRGHNTTRHNYSCYVDGNHNANDNGTDFNDRTDNNNNDKFTWVSSYTGILWQIQ